MRNILFFLLFCVIPVASWSQDRIYGAVISIEGIPVDHMVREPGYFTSLFRLNYFSYTINHSVFSVGDTYTVGDSSYHTYSAMTNVHSVSFGVDTARKQLYGFSYKDHWYGRSAPGDSEWSVLNVSFDNIALHPFKNKLGGGLRGFINGAQLAEVNLSYLSMYTEQLDTSLYETWDTLRSNAYIDSSTVEILLYYRLGSSVIPIASDDSFAVYPNPASDLLYVSTDNSKDKIEVYDMLGRIYTPAYNRVPEGLTVDISSLPLGSYYIRQGSQNRKIVISR